jgi:uroporphyrinogen-III synthase
VRPALAGRRVVTTRDSQGALDELLRTLGVEVVHVPLIEIVEPADGGAALTQALSTLPEPAWLVVTSRHGARRTGAAAAEHPHWRLAAVGSATARELERLAGRPVDVVPERHTAGDLLQAMPAAGAGIHVLIAQADRADATLTEGLAERGYDARSVTAYGTVLRTPTPDERDAALAADAVAFASGSAATAWAEAIGTDTPGCVVVIGPTTAEVARAAGLQVTHVAADHTVVGLAQAIAIALSTRS